MVGNNKGVRYWREWLKEAGWRRLVQAHEDGHPDQMVGTGNWTIRVRGRWQGRAQESETRALLEKVMRGETKWTREPLRSWMSRRGGDWKERAEECLIRAERAQGSGKEGEIQETGEELSQIIPSVVLRR